MAADRITISSDGNGSIPRFNEQGEVIGLSAADVDSNLLMLPEMINGGIAPEQAIAMMTANVARSLGINKGTAAVGQDADLCLFNDDFTLRSVMAKGQMLMENSEVLVTGTFDR